ncbi:MAG: putative ABC transporter, ATP-binding protein [Candidatus Xenolissoclinum pacificiensis L6]|uniref:ABC transporter, ATP-binding protein n=1 Tax=Candidatus Xenolissoclinum pacificiensis L6 TaxID=1401685 RepID=W2V0H5_9RICK|nr:MAG: putative ABC transporter, ATP-binding protein [Candidatus Xenolissoclinum pacificiensis L6]
MYNNYQNILFGKIYTYHKYSMSLKLENISFQYKKNKLFALQNVNLDIATGDIAGILGHSGCGKSTLLQIITGIRKPSSGKIFLHNRAIHPDLSPEHRKVGMIFQSPSLFPHKTVIENIIFAIPDTLSYKQKQEQAYHYLNLVEMEKYATFLPSMISGGQQQLVTLARAFAHQAKILLLDEPFNSLDIHLRKQMLEKTCEIIKKAKLTTLLVTHDPSEALQVSDKIYIMQTGHIQEAVTPDEAYINPIDLKTAQFFGCVNKIYGSRKDKFIETQWGSIQVPSNDHNIYSRPEALYIINHTEHQTTAEGTVVRKHIFNQNIQVLIGQYKYWVKTSIHNIPDIGDKVLVSLDPKQLLFFNH